MALAAAQVVDALAARITGLALTGSRVHTSRAWPLKEADLPAWRVYGDEEEVDTTTVHYPAFQEHALDIVLEGVTKAAANLDDALNALVLAALGAIFDTLAHATLGLTNVTLSLLRIVRGMATEGEATVGKVSVFIRARFHTMQNAPEVLV
jgi:hypothetical protein